MPCWPSRSRSSSLQRRTLSTGSFEDEWSPSSTGNHVKAGGNAARGAALDRRALRRHGSAAENGAGNLPLRRSANMAAARGVMAAWRMRAPGRLCGGKRRQNNYCDCGAAREHDRPSTRFRRRGSSRAETPICGRDRRSGCSARGRRAASPQHARSLARPWRRRSGSSRCRSSQLPPARRGPGTFS